MDAIKALLDTTAIAELALTPAQLWRILKALMLLYMKRGTPKQSRQRRRRQEQCRATILTHTLSDDGTTFTKSKVT